MDLFLSVTIDKDTMGFTLETNFYCLTFTLNERGTIGTLSIKQNDKLVPTISRIALKMSTKKIASREYRNNKENK